jgi:hypothetical protein
MPNTLGQPAQTIAELNDKLQLISEALKSQELASPVIQGEAYRILKSDIGRISGELQSLQIEAANIAAGWTA